MKKFIVLVSVAVIFLALARSASADKNVAIIKDNNILTVANTGNNIQGNSVSVKKAMVGSLRVGGNNMIITGEAKARTRFYLKVNSGLFDDGLDESEVKVAVVKGNVIDSEVNSGLNSQGNGVIIKKAAVVDSLEIDGGNSLTTGETKIKTRAWIVINSNWLY